MDIKDLCITRFNVILDLEADHTEYVASIRVSFSGN